MTPPASTRPGTTAIAAARRAVLEHLRAAGPVATARIPGRWPLTRHHVRMVIGELVSDGLVASVRGGASPVPLVAITAAGHDALRSGH